MADDPNDPGGSGESPDKPRGKKKRGGTVVGALAPGGWARRFAKLWGFLGFAIFVLVLARNVVLPFVFAVLIAYILMPVVNKLSTRPDGVKRMPRAAAIILCYIVFVGLVALFLLALLPRISQDVSRIGREAPAVYKKLNDTWAPQVARWLEQRFPSMAQAPTPPEIEPPVADVPKPPGTQFVLTPLPDGRWAVQLEATGIEVIPRSGGGVTVAPREAPPEDLRLEDKLRRIAKDALTGLQSELGGVFRFGQRVLGTIIRSVFTFFLVLMIAAFIMLDMEKIHGFARGLIPSIYRGDYDVIVAGMDSGLSGVIRGQLIICVINGVLTWIGLVVFGVKYALILATVAAILSLIPIFGSILSTIPIVLAALVSTDVGVDVPKALAILAWIVGIHLLEANFMNPTIIGAKARIHPVLVIFALVVGEHSHGLTGALLAVPVASMVQVLFVFFRNKMWTRPDPTSGERLDTQGERPAAST